eukprot:1138270-Pelagomonas_calceolata.AAC.4
MQQSMQHSVALTLHPATQWSTRRSGRCKSERQATHPRHTWQKVRIASVGQASLRAMLCVCNRYSAFIAFKECIRAALCEACGEKGEVPCFALHTTRHRIHIIPRKKCFRGAWDVCTVPILPQVPAKIGTQDRLKVMTAPILHQITSLIFLLELPHYKVQVYRLGRAVRKMEGSGLISDPFTEFSGLMGSSKDEQWYALLIVVQSIPGMQ